jgi:hypothetical protein
MDGKTVATMDYTVETKWEDGCNSGSWLTLSKIDGKKVATLVYTIACRWENGCNFDLQCRILMGQWLQLWQPTYTIEGDGLCNCYSTTTSICARIAPKCMYQCRRKPFMPGIG